MNVTGTIQQKIKLILKPVNVAKSNGAKTILINFDSPTNALAFDDIHLGKAGEILPDLIKSWLNE